VYGISRHGEMCRAQNDDSLAATNQATALW